MPLITAPYVSRIFGASGVGAYSYTFTVAQYFAYFALLGVANYGSRSIANSSNKSRTFINIYAVQLLCSFFVIVCYVVFALKFNTRYITLTCIQLLYILSAALDVTWYFFGTEQFKITTVRNCVIKVLTIVLIFVFVRHSNDVWKYTLIMSCGYFISQASLWLYIFKQVKYSVPVFSEMKRHFSSMLLLFLPVISISVYKLMDKILIEILSGTSDVGLYESAERIVNVPSLIITALGTSMLPRMSKLVSTEQTDVMRKYFETSVDFVGFLSFGMCFGLISISNLFVPLYYGSDFVDSAPVLVVLSLSLLFTSWANVIRTQYILPLKRDAEYLLSVVCGAIVNIVLNLLFIPAFGPLGSAIATVFAEAAVAFVQTLSLRVEFSVLPYFLMYVKYIISGSIMAVVLHFVLIGLSFSVISLFVCIIIGFAIYSFSALLLTLISKSPLFYMFIRYFHSKE